MQYKEGCNYERRGHGYLAYVPTLEMFIRIMIAIPKLRGEAWELVKDERPSGKSEWRGLLLLLHTELGKQIWEQWFKDFAPVNYLLEVMDELPEFREEAKDIFFTMYFNYLRTYSWSWDGVDGRGFECRRADGSTYRVCRDRGPDERCTGPDERYTRIYYHDEYLLVKIILEVPSLRNKAWRTFSKMGPDRFVKGGWPNSVAKERYISVLKQISEKVPSLANSAQKLIEVARKIETEGGMSLDVGGGLMSVH